MQRDRQLSPLFILIAVIVVIAALYVAKEILLPISVAILLSFLLTPLANRIERWGLPRVPAVIVVVLIAFALFGELGWIVTRQVDELYVELPKHRATISEKTRAFKRLAAGVERMGDKFLNAPNEKGTAPEGDDATNPTPQSTNKSPSEERGLAGEAPAVDVRATERVPATPSMNPFKASSNQEAVAVRVVEMPPSPLTNAQDWLGVILSPFATAGMIFVLVFFMLLDRENQRNRLIQLFGTSNLHRTTEALGDATYRVSRYLRMQFLVNASYGIAVAIGLTIIGVPAAFMWGVLGFSLRFLPYLGPFLSAIFPILISLAVSDGWTQPVIVCCMYIVYELILNNAVEPMLYGSSMGISTVGVLIAAIVWTWLWGPIGLIVAMPMTVCLVVMARYVPQLHFITVLLADQPPLSPAERVYQRLLAFDYHEPLKLAKSFLKSAPLVNFYDEIIIPALTLAERDRHANLLSDEEQAFVHESTEDLVADLGESMFEDHDFGAIDPNMSTISAPPDSIKKNQPSGPKARVLCVPLRDKADETASRMLGQLLLSAGFDVHFESADALTSEVIDRVKATESDVVAISALPPIGPRDSRLLWKRLRLRYPNLPIIVGYWTGPNATESLLPPPGDSSSKVATTLAEAVTVIRSMAAHLQVAKAE